MQNGLVMAERAVEDLSGVGVNARKVYVVAEQLLSWCAQHSKPNDASSRAEFARDALRTQHGVA